MARHNSHRSTHRTKNFDPLNELDNEVARSVVEPAPLIPSGIRARVLKQMEDRRRWAPGLRSLPQREPPRETSGRPARISHKPKVSAKPVLRAAGTVKHRPAVKLAVDRALPRFAEARKTLICLKRKTRREILFALKRTGKGAKTEKRYNEWSEVQC